MGNQRFPEGMMFIGGSPWFNETTGKKREPIEVYEMIYKKKNLHPQTQQSKQKKTISPTLGRSTEKTDS